MKELTRLDALLEKGLRATAPLWPSIRRAYVWVQRAAGILANDADLPSLCVRQALRTLLYEMRQAQDAVGPLASAVGHFRAVSLSHWAGLFRCYETPGVPRTNNALEQYFGSARYHERRASGRTVASPGLVVRGAVRIVAAVACQGRPFVAADLQPQNLQEWRDLRATLERRQESRRRQLRFRRDPAAYLAALETALLKPSLPS
jgi:hypothetical protein